jgi:HAD superfamily hydrolase (TIGR01509 family)
MSTDQTASDDRPLVILHTAPQPVDRIFTSDALATLTGRFTVVDLERADDPGRRLDELLPQAFAIVGQPDLPTGRVAKAGRLRALLNVEGNFYPNVDYPACFDRGIHVLGCGPAYAQAVAEYALGLALDLARGISREDRAFRERRERYLGAGNEDAVLLRHADVGLIGFGNLGRALRPLLAPFSPTIRVYDPWLPASVLREADLLPSSLEQVLTASTFVFVLAAVTSDSQHLLGPDELNLLPAGARLILVSRAAVVDFPALLDRVQSGRFLAAIDVWPSEPVDQDDRARRLEGLVLSAHRAGGIPAAFSEIGDMVVDDLTLIGAGLPPVRMQAAARDLVGRYRNRPAGTPTDNDDRDFLTIPADGVLFDCDGVLVDSDASVAQAWGRWARKYDLDPVEVGDMVHGRRAADTVDLLIGAEHRAAALDDINAFEVQDAATVTPVPGAIELTGSMAGARWAVVTSGNRILARARLSAAGIGLPEVMITADDVGNGKPDPEGYLAAADRIKVSAGRTVVFEDAVSGVLAARAAGVGIVVGVGARALETDADVVVTDLQGVSWTGRGLRIPRASILRADG